MLQTETGSHAGQIVLGQAQQFARQFQGIDHLIVRNFQALPRRVILDEQPVKFPDIVPYHDTIADESQVFLQHFLGRTAVDQQIQLVQAVDFLDLRWNGPRRLDQLFKPADNILAAKL